MKFHSDLLDVLETRGYIRQIADPNGLDALAATGVVSGDVGSDPTAPSLHVGSLVQIMLLRRLQQTGHKPIVLMGGGTGKIGDPSFKDKARSSSPEDVVAQNVASIRRTFERFLVFGDGAADAGMVDNATWLDKWAVPTNGEHRQRHRTCATHAQSNCLRRHNPADRDCKRRQNGKDDVGRRLAARRSALRRGCRPFYGCAWASRSRAAARSSGRSASKNGSKGLASNATMATL